MLFAHNREKVVHDFMLRIIASILLSTCFFQGKAQSQVKVIGQFIGISSDTIKSVSFKASVLKHGEQTLEVSAFNSFSGTIEVSEGGICSLIFKDYTYNFIIGPEPVLRFRIESAPEGQMNIFVEDSRENEAYQFTKILMRDQYRMYSYFTNCNLDSCAYMMRVEEHAYRHNRDSISKLFPGTYSADFLCRFYDFHAPADARELAVAIKREILNQTPWQLSAAYNNKTINQIVKLYFDYAPDSGDALGQSIKVLLNKTESGSVARARLGNILFGIFSDYVDESRLIQFLNLSDDIPDAVLNEKCKRIALAMPGKRAPEILLPDSGGHEISLLETAAKQTFTLLVIWNPDCSHCLAAMPVLKAVYEKFHGLGLEIFAVSLGDDKHQWLSAVGKNKCNWINVQVNEKNKSQPEDYFISYTPSLVLLNKQGVIVKRHLPVEELDERIGRYFAR